jgi:metal-sulfur cluster biosynthetic enzyme
MQDDVLCALNEIEDPELGIGIVDLGLIYRADWTATGIEVDVTMTAPSCPFGAALIDEVNEVLRQRFYEASAIRVKVIWNPPWSLERLSESAREALGLTRPLRASSEKFSPGGAAAGHRKH